MFAHGQIVGQILFVDSAKGAQKVAGGGPQAFDGVGMDLSNAIAIIVACPLFLPVTPGGMRTFDPVGALPFIGITSGVSFGVPMDVLLQRLAIRMVPYAQATLPTAASHGADNGRPIVVVRAMPPLLVGATPRRIKRIGVFLAFFPPRSETSPPSLCLDPATPARLTAHSRWPGVACASARHTGARARVPPLRRLPVRPCRSHALTTRSGVGPSYSLQRWSQYRGYRFAGRYGRDNQQSRACAGEPHAPVPVVLRSLGSADLGGESISPPTPDFHVHRVTRLWEKSLSFLTTECTN